MKRSTQMLGTASAFALAFAPTMAVAAPVGTAANSSISNSVTVSYQVGGVAQTPITSAADVFTVDRKIDLVVTTQDSSAVVVTPGQANVVTRFTVTNNSNATIDFLLAATQQSGGTAKFTGNDTTDVSNVRVFVETNGTAGWQAGDTQATSLATVASGDAVTVYVVADVPVAAAQAAQATMILTATAASGVTATTGDAGTGGTALVQTPVGTANGKATMETVFADAQAEAQTGDALRDGKHAARSDYRVDTAQLAVAKYSRVVSDPHSGSSSPRAIPGAVVEYCIVVQNTSSTVSATSVSVSDTVDATTLTSVTVPTIGGTFNGTDTCTGGSAGTWTSTAGGIYQYAVGTVAASATSLVRFQATIR